jgi:hypothetical protein
VPALLDEIDRLRYVVSQGARRRDHTGRRTHEDRSP